jgi:uncharacterized protein YdaU (DUF1376 family)
VYKRQEKRAAMARHKKGTNSKNKRYSAAQCSLPSIKEQNSPPIQNATKQGKKIKNSNNKEKGNPVVVTN